MSYKCKQKQPVQLSCGPPLELLSHDFENIRLLGGFRCNTLEVEPSFVDKRQAQEAEAEMVLGALNL